MPTFKGTTHFGYGEYGFSESWYADDTSIASLASMMTALKNLQSTRATGLANGWRIIQYRVVDIDKPGAALTEIVDLTMNYPLSLADNATTCLLARLNGTGSYARSYFVRGIPDKWTEWDDPKGEVVPTEDAVQWFRTYRKMLGELKLGFRSNSKEGIAGTGSTIVAWDTDGLRVKIDTAEELGVVPGQEVLINGMDGGDAEDKKNVNGRKFLVTKVAGTETTLDVFAASFTFYPFFNGGKAFPRRQITVPIAGGEVTGSRSKNVGKVLSTFRGRKAPKAI